MKNLESHGIEEFHLSGMELSHGIFKLLCQQV